MMFSSFSTFSTLFSTRFCTVCKWIIILIIVQRITLLTLTDQIHIIEHNDNDNDHDNVGNHHHHHHNNNDNDSGIVNITIHWPTTTIDDDEEEEDEEDNTTTRVPQSTTTTTMTTTPTTTTKPESILAATTTTTTTTGTNSDDSSSSSSSSTIFQLPNIQLIGAQKAGTTAIANYLYDIVGVCNGEIYDGEPFYFSKEIHYFDNKLRYEQGSTFYAKRFQHCYSYDHHHENENENDESSNNNSHNSTNNNDSNTNHKILSMDATPNTLGYAERVYDTYTNLHDNNKQRDELKIIVILREPVARELSLYNHMKSEYTKYVLQEGSSNETKAILADNTWYTAVANNNNNNSTGDILTFDEYVQQVTIGKWLRHKNNNTTPANTTNDDDNDEIIYHSNYYGTYFYHLRKWFHYFLRNQILVTSYDELINNPKQFEWRILSFLNISYATTTTPETTTDTENTIISETTEDQKQQGQQQQQQREATMATSTSISSSSSSSYSSSSSSSSSSSFTKSNSQSGSSKTKLPSCNAQEILSNAYKPLNDALYHLLEGGYNGIYPPIMEQRPFPKFQLGDCIP